MQIVVTPFPELNSQYEKLTEKYDELVAGFEDILSEFNHTDLEESGSSSEKFDDVLNFVKIVTAAGRFLPDTLYK